MRPRKVHHPYDPNARPWNAATPWSEIAVRDLNASLEHGSTVEETAIFLQRDEGEVRAKLRELGLDEKLQPR
jgi:hypothetical protein